jgi:hypothetical protein
MYWTPPLHKNGMMTGYILYMERTSVYSGGETRFNATGLTVPRSESKEDKTTIRLLAGVHWISRVRGGVHPRGVHC